MIEQPQFDPIKHEYFSLSGERKPSVTWILQQSGLVDFSFLEDEVRERAMARGKSVHWMLELEDQGRLNYRTVPKALRPFRKAYLDWKKASGFYPELIEHRFISRFGFAGTLDRYGRLPACEMFPRGSKAVIDLKTGSAQDAVRFQLAPYTIGVCDKPVVAKSIRRIALILRPDGSHQVKEFYRDTWDHDWAVFCEAKKRTEGAS